MPLISEEELLPELLTQADQDPWYRECRDTARTLEPGFQAFCGELTNVQREMLDEYLAAWEALQDALVVVAYHRGRTDGMKSVILPGE